MPIAAWCCGFLFCFLTGHVLKDSWTNCSVGTYLANWWQDIASLLQHRLELLPLKKDTLAQLLALTLGRREHLSPELKHLYRAAGGSHILALSGMHLGIVFGIFRIFINRMILTKFKWMAVCLALILIWSFTLLTGCPPSLIRAAVMASLPIVLQASMRSRNILDILSLSISLIVFTDPTAAFDVGFQLSCAAILGIVLIANPEISVYSGNGRITRFVLSAIWVSFAAQLATAPLCIWYFHSLAIYSTLTSLFAVPITTAILYCSIGLYLGCDLMIPVIEVLLWVENSLMEFVGSLPYSYIEF